MFSSVPTGYMRIDKERIEKDPDERVRSVLELVFRKFDELQSLLQVMLWLLDKGVELPARAHGGTRREVSWTRPTYSRVRDIMENPVYAAPTPLAAASCARRCATGASTPFRGRSRVRRTGRS